MANDSDEGSASSSFYFKLMNYYTSGNEAKTSPVFMADHDHLIPRFQRAEIRHEDDDEFVEYELVSSDRTATVSSEKEEKACFSDDEDESDVLHKHQTLVKQMRSELKNGTIRGLPTIPEESETVVAEALKPPEFDTKIKCKDVLEKVHKIYSAKMKKLDILNYQTLQAISFLKLKDSEIFAANRKKKSCFSFPKTWSWSLRKVHHDPIQIPNNKMHHDLELVYVGQLCLSWGILRWLSEKAQELVERDPQGSRSYNRAAEEFQRFQVVLQRFMEEEHLQGHRIHSYCKLRSMISTLLYVPNIKEDCLIRSNTDDVVSIQKLQQIIAESKAVFRDFLYSDSRSENGVSDDLLMDEIVATLHQVRDHHPISKQAVFSVDVWLQKEKRVKEVMKKVKKNQQGDQLLTCEVELRIVGRVLKLSRLTKDHLMWCRAKLESIKFESSEVKLEPSFSLFPS